jgi:DNA-binding NtrC family response regulator
MSKALVVCVDDDEALLTAVGRTLSREPGLLVRKSTDPKQALDWIRNDDVAVLVSDYEMPEMTGAQLAAQARRFRPETVRILLTGRQTLETAIDGIHQGEIFRFIGKPFEDKQLRAAVLEGVKRHQELKELSGELQRRERRDAIRDALEAEHPGISTVERRDGVVEVTDDPWALAEGLGLPGFRTLEPR